MAVVLRCRVRYFTDGAVLGSTEFVRQYARDWQRCRGRSREVSPCPERGGCWGDLAVVNALRRDLFG